MERPEFPDLGALRDDAPAKPERRAAILHLGARPGRGVPEGAIEDPQGLLKWLGPDRASVSLAGREDLERKSGPLVAIVRQWIEQVQAGRGPRA